MNHPLIKKDELISIWDSLEKQVLEKYQKRNEHLFDRETDRINRYFDDYPLKVENRIRKLDEEKKKLIGDVTILQTLKKEEYYRKSFKILQFPWIE